MSTYFLLGNYSNASLAAAREARTNAVVGILEELNGQIIAIYALLGAFDLALVVNLPDNLSAMKASIEISRQTGITFTTLPGIPIDHFDDILNVLKEKELPEFQLPPGADFSSKSTLN